MVRWPDRSQEQQSRSLELEKKDNIFQDFLWTSPPMSARKIQSEFSFNGEDFKYTLENQLLELAYQGDSYSFELSTSDKDIYPNIGYLEEKSRIIQSWVPKTEIVAETVAVSKTRTVPVTSTDMDGNISTSFQTEFYTDFETRFVPKTSWQWESHTEYYYEVPSFQYYLIDLGEIPFILYALEEQGEPELFLQNPSYLLGSEINQGFWGDKDVNLLFIDSNNNGIYLEEQDHMLFNSWNPYDPNSHYQEISQVMDNLWYFTRDLKDNLFMDFSLEGKTLHIDYLNEEFVGNENIG
ncbi:MAG: hypothetical protein PF447_07620 [Spirochaetaceae bacterium]|nr:hypothetical protein [Spirochaetaceae bacterium]